MYTATLENEVTIKKYTLVKDGVEKKVTNIEIQNAIASTTDGITSINVELADIATLLEDLPAIQALHPDLHEGVDTRTQEQKRQLVYLNSLSQKIPHLEAKKSNLEDKLSDLSDMLQSIENI